MKPLLVATLIPVLFYAWSTLSVRYMTGLWPWQHK